MSLMKRCCVIFFISIASYIKDAAKSCELNSEAFCNKAHQRINNELEDIFAIMLENSYPEHQRDIIVNSKKFRSWYLRLSITLV